MKKNCPGLLQFLLTCNADCHSQQQLLPVHEKELASCTSMCDGIGAYCKFKILLFSMRNATLRYNCYLTMKNNWLGVCVAGSGPATRHPRPSQGNTIDHPHLQPYTYSTQILYLIKSLGIGIFVEEKICFT